MSRMKISRKQRRLIIISDLQILIPISITGGIWGFVLYGSLYVFMLFSILVFIFGVISVIANNIDRIIYLFQQKHISFLKFQLIKFSIILFSLFIVMGVYFYEIQNEFIFTEANRKYFLISLMTASLVGAIMNLVGILNRLVGHNIIFKYLSGKYHQPKEEVRLFMFLDLKDSTSYAEKIGDKKFFSLVNELLYDIMDPVVENSGEIYKYVGDEVIITWPKTEGLKNAHCLQLYFDVRQMLKEKREKYVKLFGLFPEFKAGVHIGKVIVGEMGNYRSEIAYMGDTVNTTARIQSECNKQNADILVSQQLMQALSITPGYLFTMLNPIQLRGKSSEIQLYKVEQFTP